MDNNTRNWQPRKKIRWAQHKMTHTVIDKQNKAITKF